MKRDLRVGRVVAVVIVLAAAAAAQKPRSAFFGRIEQDNRLLALQWQRGADGALQWKDATDEDSKFEPLFARGIAAAPVGWTPFAFLLHHGDVLSLTDADFHLRRLAVDLTTVELHRFVRRPPPDALPELDELDRAIAIDLLRQRGDHEANTALAAIAADKKLSAALQQRAAPNYVRQRLDPATLQLPEDADLLLVLDHAHGVDASPLVQIGYFSSLCSSCSVLSLLKAPTRKDLQVGQSESEMVTEYAFEVVRQFGCARLDHTCIAVRLTELGTPDAFAVASAGSFDPAAADRGIRALSLPETTCEHSAEVTKASWPTASATVTPTLVQVQTKDWALQPRADLAKQLLREPSDPTLVHVVLPKGSRLLPMLANVGFAGLQRVDATFAAGERLELALELYLPDAAGGRGG
jgi:hypothetical protein